jgi:DNA-directed RNA polymerase specialized sigma24 family protein
LVPSPGPSSLTGRSGSTAAGGAAADPTHRRDPAVLLREAGAGRCEAFGSLYDLVAPQVLGAVRRVAGDRAEEAMLTAFLEVWRRAPQWPGGDAAAALRWTLRVAVEAVGDAAAGTGPQSGTALDVS